MIEAPRRPDFVVIGAQKSASTFLQVCLSEHPDVYMPKGEIPFFEDPDFSGDGLAGFYERFGRRQESLIGFKRPNYLCKPEVPSRLERYLPDARLIAVLRDPFARTQSAYFHYMKDGFLPVMPIEQGLSLILDRNSDFLRRYPRAAEILEFGKYGKALDRFGSYRARGLFRTILHEDVSAQPSEVLADVCEFLGIEPLVPSSALEKRPQRIPYSGARLRVQRASARLLTRLNESKTRSFRRPNSMWRTGLAGGLAAVDRIMEGVMGNDPPRWSAALTSRMRSEFAHDRDHVADLLGRDLSSWLGGPTSSA